VAIDTLCGWGELALADESTRGNKSTKKTSQEGSQKKREQSTSKNKVMKLTFVSGGTGKSQEKT